MHKHVANNVTVNGPAEAVYSFVDACLRVGRQAETDVAGGSGHCRNFWRPISSGWDMVIIERRDGYVQFDFITALKISKPSYRSLGRLFPSLAFHIAAIETESRWAITGRIEGDRAEFDEGVDPDDVYDRVFEGPVCPLSDEY